MKAKNRITLFLSVLTLLALLVTGMTLAISAEDTTTETDTLTTPYGAISTDFASADQYPWAVFFKAEGATTYTFKTGLETLKGISDSILSHAKQEGELVIYMRRNVDLTKQATPFSNLALTNASIIYDLGDKVLTASTSHSQGTFVAQAKTHNSYPVNDTVFDVEFTNGELITTSHQFFLVNAGIAGLDGYEFNLTFSNMTLTRGAGAAKDQPFVQMNSTTPATKLNLLYDECIFELGDSFTAGVYLFRAGNTNLTASIEVRGGEINVGENGTAYTSKLQLITAPNGNVFFTSGSNGYTTLSVPKGSTLPSGNRAAKDKDGKALSFILASSDTSDTYVLTQLSTAYGNITEAFADAQTYPWALFFKAKGATTYTFKTGLEALKGISDSILSHAKQEGELVILMRRNVDLTKQATPFTGLALTNARIVYDLGEHSLTASTSHSQGTFGAQARTHSSYPVNDTVFDVEFTNGELITTTHQFFLMNGGTAGLEGYEFNLTFSNMTLTRGNGATKDQPFVQINSTASATKLNLLYDECKFDLGNAINSTTILFDTGSGNVTAGITVKGGSIVSRVAPSSLWLQRIRTAIGKVSFVPGENGYLTLSVPTGSALPTNTYWKTTASGGGELKFRELSADGTTTDYMLCPTAVSEYVPKTSVTLYSDFGLNLYLPVNNLVSFELDGEICSDPSKLTPVKLNDSSYYLVTTRIPVTEAGAAINLKITVRVDDVTTHTTERDIGVVKYAQLLLKSSASETEKTLVRDMLSYVRSAYAFFEGSLDKDEVNRVVTVIDGIIGTGYDKNNAVSITEATKSIDGLDSACLLLADAPALVFYPETDESGVLVYSADSYVFTWGGRTADTEICTDNDGRIYIRVNMYAYSMTETVEYTVNGTEINGAYNLASYYEFAKTESDALVSLVECLWRYSVSAEAYKTEATA